MMPRSLRETDNLVFNRRAVTRPDTGNFSAKKRGSADVGPNNFMGTLIGIGNPAGQGGTIVNVIVNKRKRFRLIAVLFFQFAVINGVTCYPRRSPGF